MSQHIPILLYHSVDDHPPVDFTPWAVGREMFAEHLDMLAELGRVGLTIGQLTALIRAGDPVPERAVVVTFDDGFSDFASNAWPQLQARGLPATLYVTAGLVGGHSEWLAPVGASGLPMLDSGEIGELAAQGVEIGAHSMTHPQLDAVGRDRAWLEISESKKALEAILDRPVDTFAYPHGYHDRVTKQMVAEAGYTSAAAVRNALSHPGDDLYALARCTVMADCTAEHLAGVLDGRHAKRAGRREHLRTGVWRQVRRLRASYPEANRP
ncbi:polysaccharide deacetylase [Arthrobacter livingstonensis]|uniref:Polysaccharide deacetylase n=1 Tax=Arthrobacter livingstonensis TaxID=670078 RepID=A0A2V5L860_9MICC|nr:polysaccharide deacetylase family protein [Arthrobacter livingstonensis]PYI65813.1 polysaccharide deacetylase [Arthrobacter livingstonensis]